MVKQSKRRGAARSRLWAACAHGHGANENGGLTGSDVMLGIEIQALIIFLIVGAIAGWLAGQIMTGFGFGLVGNIILGIVGALVAGWLLPRLNVHIGGGIIGDIINALIGAIVVLFVIGLLKRA
jgi:uncharacterized membrane protein YeaQ/YmgE (transglycosylase-associated protein family)